MGRRYEEVVHVEEGSGGKAGPFAFVWRERLYVVREVLAHWHERTSWWEGPAAGAARGEDVAPPAGARTGDPGREVWRVQASAGRCSAPGTYDLGRSGATTGWRLLQVVD